MIFRDAPPPFFYLLAHVMASSVLEEGAELT